MAAAFLESLQRLYVVHRLWETERSSRSVRSRLTAIVTDGSRGASANLMESLPNLQLIACNGVGVDAIDLDAARRRGVAVTTTPDVLTDDVADLAVALMLAVCRQIPLGDDFARSGRWSQGPMALGRRASGKAAGIVGLGRIGHAVARRLTAFNMHVAYTGRRKTTDAYEYVDDLGALARNVQFLFLTAPGGSATRGIVNRGVLEALGPEGVLINVARGSLVNEDALVETLLTGRLGGAGLDVFVNEPWIPEPLKTMPNVVLLPHQGSATIESRAAMAALVLDNLAAHFAGKPLISPLTLSS
jgi:lactate dehydrogenase-like 2-hydroxyacid dehydrogenase